MKVNGTHEGDSRLQRTNGSRKSGAGGATCVSPGWRTSTDCTGHFLPRDPVASQPAALWTPPPPSEKGANPALFQRILQQRGLVWRGRRRWTYQVALHLKTSLCFSVTQCGRRGGGAEDKGKASTSLPFTSHAVAWEKKNTNKQRNL